MRELHSRIGTTGGFIKIEGYPSTNWETRITLTLLELTSVPDFYNVNDSR